MLTHLETNKARPAQQASPVKEPPAPRVEVTSDSATQFAVRVQPILMNACVKCHNSGRGGRFQLTNISGAGLADRRTMEKNLSAVLDQINTVEPRLSKLLTKSVSIHGRDMVQAPLLTGRDGVAYRTLEHWVRWTVENNPQLAERPGSPRNEAPASSSAEVKPQVRWGADRVTEPKLTAPVPVKPTPPLTTPPPTPVFAVPATPDPVDPDAFNRESHAPAKPSEGPGNGK